MPDVVGVLFHSGGKVYYFDPGPLPLAKGEQVVVQTMRGTEIGEVVDPAHEVPASEILAPLKRVVRRATPQDLEVLASNDELRREALRVTRELIGQHGLDMKLVDAEIVFGGGKIVISFYADERVDFRALVADLARALKMRIELRQIGAREEARMIGGLGPCGRNLCCRSFNVGQEPVSIRMAKEQNLPLNPMKISGLCGRLMCCLKYEQEQYVCFRKSAPKCGTIVETERGRATVVSYKVPKEALTVRYEDGSYEDVPLSGCSCGGQPCGGDIDAACGSGNGHEARSRPNSAAAGPAEVGVADAPPAGRAAGTPAERPAQAGEAAAEGAAPVRPGDGPASADAPAAQAGSAAAMPPLPEGTGEAVDPSTVSSGEDTTSTDARDGLELVVSCQAPVWTPGTAADPVVDIASVEDPPDEPPLGEAQTVVEVESPTADPAARGELPEAGPEGSGPRRDARRRRRRRPRSRGGGNPGGDRGPSSPS